MDVIKATSAADFLGLVPALIGYTPTRSIVAIPYAGSRTVGRRGVRVDHGNVGDRDVRPDVRCRTRDADPRFESAGRCRRPAVGCWAFRARRWPKT